LIAYDFFEFYINFSLCGVISWNFYYFGRFFDDFKFGKRFLHNFKGFSELQGRNF
jgi:hypothetical protein